MERFKLLLGLVIVLISTMLAAAKFLLTELNDFWEFMKHLQW